MSSNEEKKGPTPKRNTNFLDISKIPRRELKLNEGIQITPDKFEVTMDGNQLLGMTDRTRPTAHKITPFKHQREPDAEHVNSLVMACIQYIKLLELIITGNKGSPIKHQSHPIIMNRYWYMEGKIVLARRHKRASYKLIDGGHRMVALEQLSYEERSKLLFKVEFNDNQTAKQMREMFIAVNSGRPHFFDYQPNFLNIVKLSTIKKFKAQYPGSWEKLAYNDHYSHQLGMRFMDKIFEKSFLIKKLEIHNGKDKGINKGTIMRLLNQLIGEIFEDLCKIVADNNGSPRWYKSVENFDELSDTIIKQMFEFYKELTANRKLKSHGKFKAALSEIISKYERNECRGIPCLLPLISAAEALWELFTNYRSRGLKADDPDDGSDSDEEFDSDDE